jgi:hypothetical protein
MSVFFYHPVIPYHTLERYENMQLAGRIKDWGVMRTKAGFSILIKSLMGQWDVVERFEHEHEYIQTVETSHLQDAATSS